MLNRLRAAWRALFGTTALTAPEPTIEEEASRLKISQAALWEAQRNGTPITLPEAIVAPLRPMPGVMPEGMAFDVAPPQVDNLTAYMLDQAHHEGIGFLGYPYLAELSQRAEYRKINSIWAEHCTRKWVDYNGDDVKVEQLQAEMERLNVREIFREAIEKECTFGRMQIFLDFDDFDKDVELAAPLVVNSDKIKPQRPLKRLTLVEPMWSYPGMYSAQNPLAPDFYKPQAWYVSGRTVHASRLMTLVGNEVPNMLKPAYAFGGMSLTQLCKPCVDNWLRARQSVSDLIKSFSVMVLATEMDQVLTGGPATDLFARVDLMNRTRDNRGTYVIDKGTEEFTNVSAPIAGLDKLQAQAQEQMSSVSGIPLVVLLGITPSGLNASSEGEIRVFYDAIMAYNERVVAKPLKTIVEVVQLSIWGEIDAKLTTKFLALWEMSEKEKAEVRKLDAEAAKTYVDAGVVSPEEDRARLHNDENSPYHGNLGGPAPVLDDGEEDDEGKEATK